MRFLRYPGGKSRLLFFLSKYLPVSDQIDGRYIEPFLGGGSVFLHINPKSAVISDLNKELIDLYKGIQYYPNEVWDTFLNFPIGKEAYYKIRDERIAGRSLYYRAARTLYLNRTCFKGMWRHNYHGNFNVGYGGEDRRWAIAKDNLIELSSRFANAIILHSDYDPVLNQCYDGDFIFIDPPYKPGEKELLEAHYINGKFSYQDQIRLSVKLKERTNRCNIKWLMTNSAHDDICKLYNNFNVINIPQGTSNTIGVITRDSKEVLISNY